MWQRRLAHLLAGIVGSIALFLSGALLLAYYVGIGKGVAKESILGVNPEVLLLILAVFCFWGLFEIVQQFKFVVRLEKGSGNRTIRFIGISIFILMSFALPFINASIQ